MEIELNGQSTVKICQGNVLEQMINDSNGLILFGKNAQTLNLLEWVTVKIPPLPVCLIGIGFEYEELEIVNQNCFERSIQ